MGTGHIRALDVNDLLVAFLVGLMSKLLLQKDRNACDQPLQRGRAAEQHPLLEVIGTCEHRSRIDI